MKQDFLKSSVAVENYIYQKEFQGYDPYDVLKSPIKFEFFGKWGPIIAIQAHKRNPINLRGLLGIKRGYNPKAMGLFLKAYCLLYKTTNDKNFLKKATEAFNWLSQNYSKGFSGKCWGYNFPWASSDSFLPPYTPSVVVTSFVVDGVFEYFNLTGNKKAKDIIISASEYIINDIPIVKLPEGISFSYTHLSKGCCYNASLLAAEILAKADCLTQEYTYQDKIVSAIDFVLSKQHSSGEWMYSFNPENNSERHQIDFHQGFILTSLYNLNSLINNPKKNIELAIRNGAAYYFNNQFINNGRSKWRIPKKWPLDIHNQSQGIITFVKLQKYDQRYLAFSKTIATWTIKNMQSKRGYFYFRKNPVFTNKIPYIRWSQAWMMLALSEIVISTNE